MNIDRYGGFTCGAMLYNDRTIITAAHCVDGSAPASAYSVRCGDHAFRCVEQNDDLCLIKREYIIESWY